MAGLPRTIPELVKKAISGALQDVHIALPGKVLSWDATNNLADIQVMIQHPVYDDDNTRTYEDIGTLAGVPVAFLRGGGYIASVPLVAGDTGQLIFNSTPIGEWRSTGQSSQPADASRHSIGWPTFYPGLAADNNPPAAGDVSARQAGMVLGKDGGTSQILFSSSDVKIGKGATNPATYGDVNDTNFTAAKTLATAITTFCTALSAYMVAIQPVADPGGGPSTTAEAAAAALGTAAGAFSAAVLPTMASIAKVK